MAWGKLLGSTAFVWYGGIICLAAIAYGNAANLDAEIIAIYIASVVMAALIGQAISLSASLAWAAQDPPDQASPGHPVPYPGLDRRL